ncbi:nucleotidyltransferase domain-containing protein [Kyrpidia tusciae]|uniref:DNA polymerase beta domain protein region n=1 Tax=Kyrpidia tusciae (strain DSM 2912 / NBRC 15312 / T2) TaxID=562970 RepID=D5WXG4_KYRT2|nr:nucleotidyltransferase domain-containing protein [Kyrpidia tusciae]ADG05885.1 DNA polymerase beta domain protein region [Kyrpidia tusciae DSM 2912]
MVYTADQVNQAVQEYLEKTLPSAPDIEEVWLFGSYANGTPHENSDIDLAVVSPRFAEDYPAAVSALAKAVWDIEAPIQIHGFTREDFETEILGAEIRRTGKCVYKRH